ncbi:hypothetical protein APR41_14025 [Salegentibacter salinarum]|uniref:Uncharacterized protein n=1 Tax=Salegentibacter salinarum TaxID=447422 RepID=A0A2N0U065_9FLAO|nr:hypothetical protein APR41_14025 [Salegentibacter salinarum]
MLNSREVMALAKIRSRTTYHKLLRDLTNWGYLKYHPSTSPQMGSLVEMFRFDTHPVQKMNRTYPVSEQVPVQKLVSFKPPGDKSIYFNNLHYSCCQFLFSIRKNCLIEFDYRLLLTALVEKIGLYVFILLI